MGKLSDLNKVLLVLGALFLMFCWYCEASPIELLVDVVIYIYKDISGIMKSPIIIGIVIWLAIKKDLLKTLKGETKNG